MQPGHRIRILVADDHPLIRDGLSAILTQENDLEIVGQAADGEAALQLYDRLSPDILLLDLRMPKKDGMQVIHELMPRTPHPLIVVLTTSEKEEDLRVALKAGVKGYVLKGGIISSSPNDPRRLRWKIVPFARSSRQTGRIDVTSATIASRASGA
jgi:DNA-binding NarL/FixJ family response regulator